MYNIITLNKIAAIGTSRLGDNYKYGSRCYNYIISQHFYDLNLGIKKEPTGS